MDLAFGAMFDGRYRIESLIGSGGTGFVYRAHDTVASQPVALKIMRSLLAEDPVIAGRFKREARVGGELQHPNTLRVFHCGQASSGDLYMVLELLEGVTLGERIRRRALAPLHAIDIACQILGSLDEAHRAGLVHRDLKPDNVFLVPSDNGGDLVKVLDFGLVKLIGGTDVYGKLTRTGVIGGTPGYMSPEHCQDLPIDPRSDLYSVGVILFAMLTGHEPFEAEDPVDVMIAHINAPIPPLDLPGGEAPRRLGRVVRWCLQKDAKRRPADAAALRVALEQAALELADEPDSDAQRPDRTILFAGQAALSRELQALPERPSPSRMRRALPWLLAALGLLSAVAVAYLLLE